MTAISRRFSELPAAAALLARRYGGKEEVPDELLWRDPK